MKKRILSGILIVCLMLTLSPMALAGESQLADVMTAETYEAKNGINLPYRLYVPSDYDETKAYSLLLFLHGAGNRGKNNTSQISENIGLIERIIGGETVTYDGETIDTSKEFIIVAPQCGKDFQWVDTPWGAEPDPSYILEDVPQSQYMTAVMELLDVIRKNYKIDNTRQYVTGLSMGGFGTWDLLMRYPSMWAAAIPMGGGADLSKADIIRDIPIWTFHQYMDTVVQSEGTRNMVAELVKAGADIKFTPYFERQHNAWTKGYAEEDMLNWLYSHKKEKASASEDSQALKIAFVGDSITYGAELTKRKSKAYPFLLGQYFGDKAIVENFGVSGTSALKSSKKPYVDTEEYKKSLEFAPDILFIMLGTNDIKTENWVEGSENFEKDYTDIINSYKEVNPDVKIYMGIPPRIFKDNVYGERSTKVLEEEAFPKIANVAEAVGAELVDIFSATLNYERCFPDFLHPDAEGHEIIARLVRDTILKSYDNLKKEYDYPLDGASAWALKELGLSYAIGLVPQSVVGIWKDDITREQFCESVTAMIPSDITGERTAAFTDTDNSTVNRAYSLGIVSGFSEDTFGPDKKITREEICAMLQRAYKIIAPEAEYAAEKILPDKDSVSDWAIQSVDFMSGSGILAGDENGNVNPKANTTCEQGIALVYRTFISANSYGK